MTLLSELDPDVAYPATPTVPESGLHSLARFVVYGALRAFYASRAGCYVGEDRNIYWRRGDGTAVVAPDVFVSLGVDPESLATATSYRVWEVGAPPAFVLEIASEKTFKADLETKPAKYLDMGVGEYWRFDPTGGEFLQPALQGDRRAGNTWQPITINTDDHGHLGGHSETLDLTLHADAHRLRFRNPRTGEWLPDPDEQAARADRVEAELAALRRRLDPHH